MFCSLREGVEDFSMIASTEELVQWLQGPQYEAALATLPQPLPSPEAGELASAFSAIIV